MKLIIKNGTLVTASDTFKADIAAVDGIITEIAQEITPNKTDKVIDAEGKYVLPGGIDPHTHFAHPDYADNFEDGTKAAAAGGITCILNYCEPPAKGDTLLNNFRTWKEKAKDGYIDYGIQPIITEPYMQEFIDKASELEDEGVTTIKLFMSARGIGLLVSDSGLHHILKKVGEKNMLATIHCENGDVIDNIIAQNVAEGNTSTLYHGLSRPTYLEAEATNRILSIAEATGASVRIAHISCKEAMDELARAQEKGLNAYGESCVHYLTKDITDLDKEFSYSARYICAPPLREKWNQEALWEGINNGIISSIGSDHAPVAYEYGRVNKLLGKDNFSKIPNGGPGTEEFYSVLYHYGVHEGRISLQKFVQITSQNTAKEMGIYPQKGSLSVGSDADIVILDPNQKRTLSVETQVHKCDYNAYEGVTVNCVLSNVISRGEEVARDGKLCAEAGRGKYLYRNKIDK